MPNKDKNDQRAQEWKEIEECQWRREIYILGKFGFDIRIYWNKKETKDQIKKRHKRLKIIENILKIILIGFIVIFVIYIILYIARLYGTLKVLY